MGTGFCPLTHVAFSMDGAMATATQVDPSGLTAQVEVPRYAVSGPVQVYSAGTPTLAGSGSFLVQDFRRHSGFGFVNDDDTENKAGGRLFGWDDMDTAFGDNAYITIPFTSVRLLQDPLVVAVMIPVANALSAASSGLCWGMVRASQIIVDENSITKWTSGAAQPDLFWAPETANLGHFIHGEHVAQISVEFIYPWLDYHASNVDQFISDIRAAVKDGGAFLAGYSHVIEPYDVEEKTDRYLVHCYNPNLPFAYGEYSGSGAATYNIHEKRMTSSALTVMRTGQYSMDDGTGNHWQGNVGDPSFEIGLVPKKGFPRYPTPLVSLSFSSAIGVVGGVTGLVNKLLAIFSGDSTTPQVADAAGHTAFNADGSFNTGASRLPNAKRFFGKPGKPQLLIVRGDGGVYTHTLTAKKPGPTQSMIFGPGYAFVLSTTAAKKGETDRVQLTQSDKSVKVAAGSAKVLAMKMLIRVDQQTARAASINTTGRPGAPVQLAWEPATQSFRYVHAGGSQKLDVQLEQTGKTQVVRKLSVAVDAGDELHLQPDWSDLSKGGSLRVRKPNATESTRPLP